jgi:DNA-binding response OmpR family regulator
MDAGICATILVVDDEPPILDLIKGYLQKEDFVVATAADGPSALVQADAVKPDLIVLDLRLPGLDGLEVCRRIRARSSVPIVMLTAKVDDVDKLVGFAVGADDYVTKPFNPKELVARIKAVLRRSQGAGGATAVLRRGELVIDLDARRVSIRGTEVLLTPREFDLLVALARSPGRVFTRQQLIERCWGPARFGDLRVVDTHIANLRKKIEADPESPQYIKTVHGVGYRFEPGDDR